MRINNVVGFTSGNVGRNIAFGRAPKKGNEEREYKQTIQNALDYLGIQNQAMVIHAPSFPAQGNFDVEIGSFVGADELVEFAKLHGFNGIQLGPNGKLNRGDTSPYTSSIFEKNPLFINVSQLTTAEFASILTAGDIKNNAKKVKETGKNFDRVDYKDAAKNIDELMGIAFDNFSEKLAKGDAKAKKLNAQFEKFKKQNAAWIEFYAVLDVLGRQYGTDFYPNWKKEDQDLIQDVKKGDLIAKERFAQIQKDNAQQIEKYKFTQFIIAKQTELDNKKRNDFTFIADLEVGASSLDELVFKDVFLPDYKLGCKYGGVANSPQLWGIAVPDPNKLFNKDGSLGPAGYYIKAKIQNGLAGAQNIRIDHVMGLVNPYIYKPETVQYAKKMENGKLVEYPLREKMHAGYMTELGIDRANNYQKVISKIVIPAMREMGVNPQNVVWEDLGSDETGVFDKIFREQLGLPGISGMIWTKASEAQQRSNNWAYIGCHDNKPGKQLILDGDIKTRDSWKADYLADALRPDPYKKEERRALQDKISKNPKELWKAKVAELFRSTKQIQISFMDFFGIDKAYNTPGTTGGDNWTLRLNSNFKETYYKSLEQGNGWAINMPEVLQTAVQAKFDEDVSKNGKPYWETKAQVDPLMRNLEHWTQVLKEKE